MRRLGYRRYVSQGGDWGAVVTDVLGRQAPDGLVGIHVTTLLGAIERPPTANTQTAIPPEVAKALKNGELPPAGLSAEETIAYEASKSFAASGSGFRAIQGTCPQTIGYSLSGLAGRLGRLVLREVHGVDRHGRRTRARPDERRDAR